MKFIKVTILQFILTLFFIGFLLPISVDAQTTDTYYPSRFSWDHKSPEEVGMNAQEVQAAVDFAIANESENPHDLGLHLNTRTGEPYNNIIGPVKERGPMTGLIIKDGYIVAEWGEP